MAAALLPVVAALLLLAPLSALAQSATLPVVLTRYQEPLEVMCLSQPPDAQTELGPLLSRAKARMAKAGGGRGAAKAAARLASIWSALQVLVQGDRVFDSSHTLMVGSAATLQNGSTICTPNIDVQLYAGGAFTPYVLPAVVAETAWQVSFWRNASATYDLAIANAVPRSLMVQLQNSPMELDPSLASNTVGPESQSTAQILSPYLNQSYGAMGMVNAYFAQNGKNMLANALFGAVLVQVQPDPALGGVHYVVAYVMGATSGSGLASQVAALLGVQLPPMRFALFQASFFVESGAGRRRRRLLGGGRKLKYYESSGTDSSHSGACGSGTCNTCKVLPPGCYRGSRTWPRCAFCCYCV